MKTRKGYTPAGRLYSTFWSNLSKNFSFGGLHPCRCTDGGEIWHGEGNLLRAKFHPHWRNVSTLRWGWNLAWSRGPSPCQISPHRCNVSLLRREKPQNRPVSKLNTGRLALRAMLPVIMVNIAFSEFTETFIYLFISYSGCLSKWTRFVSSYLCKLQKPKMFICMAWNGFVVLPCINSLLQYNFTLLLQQWPNADGSWNQSLLFLVSFVKLSVFTSLLLFVAQLLWNKPKYRVWHCLYRYGSAEDPKPTEEWTSCRWCMSWYHDSCDYIFTFLSLSHHCKALNSLLCADVPLRNYSLTHSCAEDSGVMDDDGTFTCADCL